MEFDLSTELRIGAAVLPPQGDAKGQMERWADRAQSLEEQLEAATKALETPRQYDVLLSDMKEQFEALRNFNEATRRAYATLTSSEVSSYPSKDSGVGPGPSDSATSSPASEPKEDE